MNNHSLQNTREEPIAAETAPAAPAAHTRYRYLSSPAAATLHRETQGFVVLQLSSQIKTRATFMQPLQCLVQHRGQHASLYAHGNRTRQQSCSHDTVICNQRIKKRIEIRRHGQPLVAEHTGGTGRGETTPAAPAAYTRYQVPFIAGCSHLTRKNTRFLALAFATKQAPCNIHAAIALRCATRDSTNA